MNWESEDKYRNIVESSDDGIFILQDGVIQFANRGLARMLDRTQEELCGKSMLDYVHPDELDRFGASHEAFDSGKEDRQRYETRLSDGQGTFMDVGVRISPTLNEGKRAALVVVRDITELKRMEARKEELEKTLQQTQRMEAIGTLAGGIAHEFNNILWIISANAEYSLQILEEGSGVRKNLERIQNACERASSLVGQILSFSRRGQHRPRPLDMRAIVKETLKFMRASVSKSIDIVTEIAPDLGMVMADPTQLHQVMTNLCTNAVYAMREAGGALEVSLRNTDPEKEELTPSGLAHGRYVKLRVRDEGAGMEPAVMKRVFEPFFTTKQVGEGAGLGLSVVYGIIESYQGAVTVISEPGKGSTFDVFLPIIQDETNDKTRTGFTPRGKERVLFVDDDPSIVDSAEELLEALGYRVDVETQALEALEIFKRQPDSFALVITDMSMPRMSGETLSRKMLRVRPDIPIIICTRYGELINEERIKEIGIREIIPKPATVSTMAQTIRRVLDKGPPGPVSSG